jgi:hypothetical protein
MATARVNLMIQDPEISQVKGIALFERVELGHEDFFLDGPVSRRVAVLDFDPATGELVKGARFTPSRSNPETGQYQAQSTDVDAADFMQINVFGTVFQTMYMFEEAAALGRRLDWAFDGPQLLVVPRAGEWANAFYERESRSLQFFSFEEAGKRVHTCLSRDVVAHETGHAILDGIAPDLYHAITPQSLALHEAIADVVAVLMAFRSRTLRSAVLEHTGGSIADSTAFNSIAEQFGRALDRSRRTGYLRNLKNDLGVNDVGRDEPHELSQVVSGALYSLMVKVHGDYRERYEKEGLSPGEAAGKALRLGGELWKRLALRALDYLPPGEVSFADYGRAVIAADQAAYPQRAAEREWVVDEFVRRGMVPDRKSLEVETDREVPALADINLETLAESDWAAYQFANDQRRLLGVPADVPFRVLPRKRIRKTLFMGGSEKPMVEELVFKVSWDHTEPNTPVRGLPRRRQVTAGTTLVVDWATRRVRSCLTSDLSEEQQVDRDSMIARLLEDRKSVV